MNASANPPVYFVGDGQCDTHAITPEIVGNKAFSLMRMGGPGLPVPPAFVIGTAVCREFLAAGERLPDWLPELLAANVRRLENATGRTFGGHRRPLLVSVRSGSPVSMPGMMESVLNVGLNDTSVQGLVRMSGNARLAWDSYRRLAAAYANVVHGCPLAPFDALARGYLRPRLFPLLQDLDGISMRALARDTLDLARATSGAGLPQDPMRQLTRCVAAVFRSWRSDKARSYRRLNGLDDDAGTAVTVQAMVFGNAGGTSGSGVGFTRDPSTGANALYLDFLFNSQGEDVVSGRRAVTDGERLATLLPDVHARLLNVKSRLEAEFGDLQDFEFTVQDGELFLLQTRAGKRTPWAALKVAVDLVDEGLIDVPTALARIRDLDLDAISSVRLADADPRAALASATPASIGAASGVAVLESERARRVAAGGAPVILVREDIATEDIDGMAAAAGVLTARGGRTSHAAVVARQMGKVCLVGCGTLSIDESGKSCRIGETRVREGEWLSLDGNDGRVFSGQREVLRERPSALLARVAKWRRTDAVA